MAKGLKYVASHLHPGEGTACTNTCVPEPIFGNGPHGVILTHHSLFCLRSSRIIVKNLPKQVTDQRMREHFAQKGEITDVRLQYTKYVSSL